MNDEPYIIPEPPKQLGAFSIPGEGVSSIILQMSAGLASDTRAVEISLNGYVFIRLSPWACMYYSTVLYGVASQMEIEAAFHPDIYQDQIGPFGIK